jgi:hypothetical protein
MFSDKIGVVRAADVNGACCPRVILILNQCHMVLTSNTSNVLLHVLSPIKRDTIKTIADCIKSSKRTKDRGFGTNEVALTSGFF